MIIEIHKSELEDLIRERMATGEFRDVEDVLFHALRSSAKSESVASTEKGKLPLGQFLLASPLRDSGLKLERQRDYPRPSDL